MQECSALSADAAERKRSCLMPAIPTTKGHCLFHYSGCLTKPDYLKGRFFIAHLISLWWISNTKRRKYRIWQLRLFVAAVD